MKFGNYTFTKAPTYPWFTETYIATCILATRLANHQPVSIVTVIMLAR